MHHDVALARLQLLALPPDDPLVVTVEGEQAPLDHLVLHGHAFGDSLGAHGAVIPL